MTRLRLSAPVLTKILSCLSALSVLVFIVLVATSHLVPLRYALPVSIVLAALSLGAVYVSFRKSLRRRNSFLIIAGSIILIVISCIGIKLTSDSLQLLHAISSHSSSSHRDIVTTKPFNIYISGIDTYGSIATVSRSDVNIVATVNPLMHKILLTTIPRDSYVRIAGGGHNQYDKLTHSGNYGISSSSQTVARLLHTDLNDYVRINFTSFIAIIDQIGGVDVNNPVTFTTDDGQTFHAGMLHLNGKDALTFSRERHNLAGGDNDRGVNQERVVSAIFTKLSSANVLKHYQSILRVLSSSIQSNITEKSYASLINQQLDHQDKWKVTMTTVSGVGQTGGLPSYAMPGSQLYMFVINDTSLHQAQARIQAALSAS